MAITRATTDIFNEVTSSSNILSPTRDLGTGDGTPTAMSAWTTGSARGGDTGTATTSYVGFRMSTGTLDLSSRTYIGWQMIHEFMSPGSLDTFANGGMRIVFDDGTNWAAYECYGGEFPSTLDIAEGAFGGFTGFASSSTSLTLCWFLDRDNRATYASSGTISWSAVTHIELHFKPASSMQCQCALGRIITADRPIFTGTTSDSVWRDYNSALTNSGLGYVYPWHVRQIQSYARTTFQVPISLQIGCQIGDGSTTTTLNDSNKSLTFWGRPEDYSSTEQTPPSPLILTDAGRILDIYTSAICNINLDDFLLSSTSSVGLRVRGNVAGSVDLPRLTCAPFDFTMELGHGTFTNGIWADGLVPVKITSNTTLTGGSIRNSYGMEIDDIAGDYSAITCNFDSNNVSDLKIGDGGAGTYTLTGVTTSGTLYVWNPNTSNSVTVTLAQGVANEPIDLWFNYDNEVGGPFTLAETLTFGNGATAKLQKLVDNGTTGTMYCELLTGSAPPDNNSITGGTSSATANVNEASGANSSTLTINQAASTYTFTSDTASTLIRYFENDSQTIVDSTTGTSLAYEFPDADPMDVEFLKQNYVPVNRQNIVPVDGGTLDIIMDYDEAYNSSHGLTITTEFDYNRGTKVFTFNSDQEALDVRSAMADTIRTNSSYYNTPLLLEAIPGLTRIDLIDGATITSMAPWKGAGMERFDSADALNPVEKWFAIKSVGTITGATVQYRQTSSGNSTNVTLTSNIVNEAFQYWSDPNHDGSTADGYDYSDYMVIKSFLAGSKQGRVDVVANAGVSNLSSNLYTVPLSNESHSYSGTDPGITGSLTLVAGSTVGGVAFSYEWVDGASNSGANIADQINYNCANIPNSVIAGGTGLRWFEIPDCVIYNASSVETERGYREGTTATLVGFYVSRSSADHPDFTRFQGDNGSYYTPATVAQISAPNLTAGRIQVINKTGQSASAWAASTAYNQYDKVLRSTGTGSESGIGLYFQCTTAGTTSGTEPTWDTTPGNTTADGTVTWTCRAIEFDNTTMTTGYSNSWTDHEDFDNGDTIGLYWVDEDDLEVESEGVATAAGTTSFLNTPVVDTVYNTYAIDGSTVTEFTADFPNVEVDVNDPDNLFYLDRFYAWWKYNLTTADGIRNFFGGVTAVNASNLIINDSIVDIFFDNVKAVSARQGDQIVIQRDDGVYPQADPTSGGGGLGFYYAGIGYTAETGTSGLTPAESAVLTSMTFSKSGELDVNIKSVQDTTVTGSGTSGDPWGP